MTKAFDSYSALKKNTGFIAAPVFDFVKQLLFKLQVQRYNI
jgi:hypothetical protein